jgi:dTDP-L-rhamnose 4-epimerase
VGFVGSFVVDELVASGHEVVVVDSLHPQAHRDVPPYLNPDAEYVWADLRDPTVAARVSAGVDAVSHQASMVGLGVDFGDVMAYVANNDVATAALLGALHDRRFRGRIVLASSMVVYGEGRYRCTEHGVVRVGPRRAPRLERGEWEPPCPLCEQSLVADAVPEDAPVDPRNVYAATKLHQEHLVAAYGREHEASTIVLRYHNVYGPRMPRNTPYAGVASIFRSAYESGEAPRVLEDGGQRRDFVHVHDVARANVAALSAPPSVSTTCNVASGRVCTILEMADALATAYGDWAPRPQVVGGYRIGDVRHVFASVERARDVLGFSAAIPPERGLAEFAGAALRT